MKTTLGAITDDTPYHTVGSMKKQGRQEVRKFQGANDPLSNWFRIEKGMPIYTNDSVIIVYSVEVGFKYQCAIDAKDFKVAEQILRDQNARKAYEVGKKIKKSDSWDGKQKQVMKDLIKQKIKSCKEFKIELRLSQDKLIIEDTANPNWGRGTRDNPGKNWMGEILMQARMEMVDDADLDSQSSDVDSQPDTELEEVAFKLDSSMQKASNNQSLTNNFVPTNQTNTRGRGNSRYAGYNQGLYQGNRGFNGGMRGNMRGQRGYPRGGFGRGYGTNWF